jgi:hypothetical protein
MKCHTNVNSTPPTQLPDKFSYIVAILIHNHFESPNIKKIKCTQMKCHTNVNSTPLHNCHIHFRYIVAIFIHNHFEFFESLNSTPNFLHFG